MRKGHSLLVHPGQWSFFRFRVGVQQLVLVGVPGPGKAWCSGFPGELAILGQELLSALIPDQKISECTGVAIPDKRGLPLIGLFRKHGGKGNFPLRPDQRSCQGQGSFPQKRRLEIHPEAISQDGKRRAAKALFHPEFPFKTRVKFQKSRVNKPVNGFSLPEGCFHFVDPEPHLLRVGIQVIGNRFFGQLHSRPGFPCLPVRFQKINVWLRIFTGSAMKKYFHKAGACQWLGVQVKFPPKARIGVPGAVVIAQKNGFALLKHLIVPSAHHATKPAPGVGLPQHTEHGFIAVAGHDRHREPGLAGLRIPGQRDGMTGSLVFFSLKPKRSLLLRDRARRKPVLKQLVAAGYAYNHDRCSFEQAVVQSCVGLDINLEESAVSGKIFSPGKIFKGLRRLGRNNNEHFACRTKRIHQRVAVGIVGCPLALAGGRLATAQNPGKKHGQEQCGSRG